MRSELQQNPWWQQESVKKFSCQHSPRKVSSIRREPLLPYDVSS
jgi:hypothetical protein